MKKIIYTRPDGGIVVVHPVINTHPTREAITEEDALQRAWDRLPPDADDAVVVDQVPEDRTFREAWRHGGDQVNICMVRCRELHRNWIRIIRAPKLAALDIAQLRGQDVEKQKQALRDAPADPRIDKAQTTEELKKVIPECLTPIP